MITKVETGMTSTHRHRRLPTIPEAQRGESPLSTSSGIVWTSSNPEVATVDSSGVVTGVELGEATITATLNGAVIETYTVLQR